MATAKAMATNFLSHNQYTGLDPNAMVQWPTSELLSWNIKGISEVKMEAFD